MAHHRLGEREQARAAVSRLRELLKKTDQAQNEEARAFLPEVEAIEPDLAFADRPGRPVGRIDRGRPIINSGSTRVETS